MRFYTGLVIAASAPGVAQCTIRQHTQSDRTSPIPLSDLRAVEKCQLAKGDPNEKPGAVNKNCYDGPPKEVTSGEKPDGDKRVSVIFVGSAETRSEARRSNPMSDACQIELLKRFAGHEVESLPVNGETDAGLSRKGIVQATMLNSFFETGLTPPDTNGCFRNIDVKIKHQCLRKDDWITKKLAGILRDSATRFATSNLKAGLLTAVVSLDGFLQRDEEDSRSLQVLSALQEIGSGSDTRSSVTKGHSPPISWGKGGNDQCPYTREKIKVDSSCNFGDRNGGFNLFSSKGVNRLKKFCDWAYGHANDNAKSPTLVVVGHHEWFHSLYKASMDAGNVHGSSTMNGCDQALLSRDLELDQTSVVRFKLNYNAGLCTIHRGSTELLYGGFRSKKSAQGNK